MACQGAAWELPGMIGIPATRLAWSKLDLYSGPRPEPHERKISVTSLVAPPKIARLKSLHRDELPSSEPRYVNGKLVTPDTWALFGTALHAALEAAAKIADPPPLLVEKRLHATVTVEGVLWELSGQLDVQEADGILWDWKSTSAYSVSDGRKGKSEWETQLNVLSWLLTRNGHPRPSGLAVYGFYRDWSRKLAGRDGSDYPEDDEGPVPIAHWTEAEQYGYVLERLRLHEAARHTLPDCNDVERWARGSGWAVLPSLKSPRAAAILETREDAERYLAEVRGGKGVIERRPGQSNRCADYCPVKDFCLQHKLELDNR